MRPHTLAQPDFTPVFNWNPRRGRKLSLISFISASAVVHALCFYIFQVIYPPTIALLPPPARVTVISPNTDEGRLLLRWIEAEDPALSSTTQRPPDATSIAPPKPAHVPSYAGRVPPLREVAPHEPDLRVPSPQPPGPVPVSRAAPTGTAGVVPTTLTFADAAGRVGAPHIPPLQFTTSSKEPPQAAQFRVGISERGHVQYCFIESSSGVPALDEQARSYIVRARFPALSREQGARSNTLFWTTATVEWGNDIATDGGRRATLPAEPPKP